MYLYFVTWQMDANRERKLKNLTDPGTYKEVWYLNVKGKYLG